MELFFVNEKHKQNYKVLLKDNMETFKNYAATKAGAYILAHPTLYLTYESESTKCLNGWTKRYEETDSEQIPILWGLAEHISGGVKDVFIHEALEELTNENYKVLIQAMDLFRYVRNVVASPV